MTERNLFSREIPSDKGQSYVHSPAPLGLIGTANSGEVVVVHDGWGKDPSRLEPLLREIVDAGYMVVAVDTRYAEPNPTEHGLVVQKRSRAQQLSLRESEQVGDRSAAPDRTNWFAMRRVVALQQVLGELGIVQCKFVGFSEGARITGLAATEHPESTDQLIAVNPAGSGDSWHGYRRMLRNNIQELKAVLRGEVDPLELCTGAIESAVYFGFDPRRVLQEKRINQATSNWMIFDTAVGLGIPVTVLAAKADDLVSYAGSSAAAAERPNIIYIPTEGRHSNITSSEVRRLIVTSLHSSST